MPEKLYRCPECGKIYRVMTLFYTLFRVDVVDIDTGDAYEEAEDALYCWHCFDRSQGRHCAQLQPLFNYDMEEVR